MEEFVVGFMKDDPYGLTPIDIVTDVTGLSYHEIQSCCKTIEFEEQIPEYEEEID